MEPGWNQTFLTSGVPLPYFRPRPFKCDANRANQGKKERTTQFRKVSCLYTFFHVYWTALFKTLWVSRAYTKTNRFFKSYGALTITRKSSEIKWKLITKSDTVILATVSQKLAALKLNWITVQINHTRFWFYVKILMRFWTSHSLNVTSNKNTLCRSTQSG